MKKPNPIRIPAELTGAGDIYVIPDTVQEIVGSFASLKIAVQHAGTIELNPEPKRRMLARGELTSLLFPSGLIAKADEVFALTKRWLNPDCIEAVNFTGGVLRFALRGGREVCVLGTFDKYRAVMALLYGPESAGKSLLWTQREMGRIQADLNRGDYRAAASRVRRLSRPRMTAAQVREQTTQAKQRLALRAEYLRLICIP